MKKLPKKRDILERARNLSTKRAAIHGLPTITPTEAELKETGVYHEARIDLMRREETGAFAQQEHYMQEMAGEMGLAILKKREHREQLRKAEAFDIFREKYPRRVKKVNGYKIVLPAIPQPSKRVKPQPRRKVPSPATLQKIESLIPERLTDRQLVKRLKQLRTTKRDWISGKLSNRYYRGIADPGGVTGKVPKDVFLFTNLDPTIKDFEKEIIKRRKPRKPSPKPKPLPRVSLRKPLDVGVAIRGAPKPKKKRKRNHTQRTGKTMRKLRKVKGVKVFSFPDDVWKIKRKRRGKK